MFKLLSLFAMPKPRPRKLIRAIRRLVHQRNYWRNRTKQLRGRKRR